MALFCACQQRPRGITGVGERGFKFSPRTALQRTQHSQHLQGSNKENIRRQWVAAYVIMFVALPSDSAFHKVRFKRGADAGFLLLQPDTVKKPQSLVLSETKQMSSSAAIISEVYPRGPVSLASCSAAAQGYCGHRNQQSKNFLQLHCEG